MRVLWEGLRLPCCQSASRCGMQHMTERTLISSHFPACRRVVDECVGALVPAPPGPTDTVHLVAGRAGSPPPARPTSADLLQQLPGEHFRWVLEAVLLAVATSLNHYARWVARRLVGGLACMRASRTATEPGPCVACMQTLSGAACLRRVGAAVQSLLAAAKAPRQQLAAAASECRDVCQAVAEVAVGRWAKMLSGRAHGGAGTAFRRARQACVSGRAQHPERRLLYDCGLPALPALPARAACEQCMSPSSRKPLPLPLPRPAGWPSCVGCWTPATCWPAWRRRRASSLRRCCATRCSRWARPPWTPSTPSRWPSSPVSGWVQCSAAVGGAQACAVQKLGGAAACAVQQLGLLRACTRAGLAGWWVLWRERLSAQNVLNWLMVELRRGGPHSVEQGHQCFCSRLEALVTA